MGTLLEEHKYDWDSAPGLDLNNVYKLPILCQHVNHGNDIHQRSTGNDDAKCKNLKKFQLMTPVPIPPRLAPSAMSQTTTRVPSQ
jgi:hypothetical protein